MSTCLAMLMVLFSIIMLGCAGIFFATWADTIARRRAYRIEEKIDGKIREFLNQCKIYRAQILGSALAAVIVGFNIYTFITVPVTPCDKQAVAELAEPLQIVAKILPCNCE